MTKKKWFIGEHLNIFKINLQKKFIQKFISM
jgi:hypothetical protein